MSDEQAEIDSFGGNAPVSRALAAACFEMHRSRCLIARKSNRVLSALCLAYGDRCINSSRRVELNSRVGKCCVTTLNDLSFRLVRQTHAGTMGDRSHITCKASLLRAGAGAGGSKFPHRALKIVSKCPLEPLLVFVPLPHRQSSTQHSLTCPVPQSLTDSSGLPYRIILC